MNAIAKKTVKINKQRTHHCPFVRKNIVMTFVRMNVIALWFLIPLNGEFANPCPLDRGSLFRGSTIFRMESS